MPRMDELLEKLGNIGPYKGLLPSSGAKEDQAKTTPRAIISGHLPPSNGLWMSSWVNAISIFSQSWEEHVDHPGYVFKRLKAANLKAKVRKCQLAMEEGHYLGH
jgi:hypothetical protein